MPRYSSRARQRKIDGWYKVGYYAHFDNPLPYKDALLYVSDAGKIARHPFLPFLIFEKKQRQFSVVAGGKTPQPATKVRSLAMPSHRDGHVFAWYARLLSEKYETLIASLGLDLCVLAYRLGGNSVAYIAERAFADVASRPACLVITLDIEKFVPSINHAQLKVDWARVIQQPNLPRDHYAVFKAVTRHAGVDRASCLAALNIDPKSDLLPHPLCSGPRFRHLIRDAGLITVNTKPHGLPQGCQLSAILSNVALLRFDEAMLLAATAFGGSYRRYCDDILFVLNPETSPDDIVSRVQSMLSQLGPSLKLNMDKTEVVAFARDVDGRLHASKKEGFQYLGFTFDGQRILMRSSTISRYFRRLAYALRKAENAANATGTKMYRRSILRRFSPLGKNNLLSRHVKLSQMVMQGDHIRRQFRRVTRKVLNPRAR